MKQKQIRCPYCGSIAILRDASYVYGNKAKDGKLYVCSHFPQCNSYVGVHPGTTNAKGKLALELLGIFQRNLQYRAGEKMTVECMYFSKVYGLLGETENARAFLKEI